MKTQLEMATINRHALKYFIDSKQPKIGLSQDLPNDVTEHPSELVHSGQIQMEYPAETSGIE